MSFLSPLLFRTKQGIRRRLGRPYYQGIDPFELPSSRRDQLLAQATTDIERLFFSHHGRLVHKCVHYLKCYHRHFERFRGRPLTMIEIGVSQGGSLELWRNYFGDQAVIAGIDIDPACATRVDPPNRVFIGSQDDPGFLESVVGAVGRPDIVLDDGSHLGRHQRATFAALFPHLKEGGVYAFEDTCTSYWQPFEGGYHKPGTAIELAKTLIDDMHAWYHQRRPETGAQSSVTGLHVYDSMIFIEKGERGPLQHIRVGGSTGDGRTSTLQSS